MTNLLPRALLLLALTAVIGLAAPAKAQAAPVSGLAVNQLVDVQPKVKLRDLAPKVRFKAGGSFKGGKASIKVSASISFAGKTWKVNVLDMGIAKSKKSVTVKRKIGKLKVKLTISWSGSRTLTIKGSARYMKFKIPVPKLKIRV